MADFGFAATRCPKADRLVAFRFQRGALLRVAVRILSVNSLVKH